MKENKRFELLVTDDGIRLRHSNPNPLTAEQKYTIILTAIGAGSVLTFFGFMFMLFSR